jgi:hypothetical protein
MAQQRFPLDRSAAFTYLLELDADFAQLDLTDSSVRITQFLAAWYRSDSTDMFAFCQDWLHATKQVETRLRIARLFSAEAVGKAHDQHVDSLVDYTHPDVVALSHMSIRDLVTTGGQVTDAAALLCEIADQEGWS